MDKVGKLNRSISEDQLPDNVIKVKFAGLLLRFEIDRFAAF